MSRGDDFRILAERASDLISRAPAGGALMAVGDNDTNDWSPRILWLRTAAPERTSRAILRNAELGIWEERRSSFTYVSLGAYGPLFPLLHATCSSSCSALNRQTRASLCRVVDCLSSSSHRLSSRAQRRQSVLFMHAEVHLIFIMDGVGKLFYRKVPT